MNTLRKSIIIGMAVLGLGGSALVVQAAEAPEHGAKHAQMQAKWAERSAMRQQKLHDTLKLTPAQEASWAAYSAAIKPAARPERGARADWKALAAPERMAKRIEMTKEHLAMMESQLAATTTFYGTLTPEQKKLFDANSMGRGGRHTKHRMHS
jgi:Spy/CpxP family protein refolding chaperone